MRDINALLTSLCFLKKVDFPFFSSVLNSFVHTVMHSLQESVWWKGKSTRLQMIVALIIFATVILPLIGYRITQRGKFFEILAAIGFLALFYKFYMKTAIEKPLNKKEESLNSKTTSYNHRISKPYNYDPSDTGIQNNFGLTDLVEGDV
ncbi:uncharacterized protein LOC129963647 [Argiope bruennichi]|uniref:uncharacterized protein LOC129963647 n=1 Tax=Argiope bruennichi TaxID=94029 RepID=UPI0024945609|nr:uncharacterized protein LOC129963647 [Argiope bruennichi]